MRISSKECKALARASLVGNYMTVIGSGFCMIFVMLLFGFITRQVVFLLPLVRIFLPLRVRTTMLLYLISTIIASWLTVIFHFLLFSGYQAMCLKIVKGERVGVDYLFFAFTKATKKFLLIGCILAGLQLIFLIPNQILIFASYYEISSLGITMIRVILGTVSLLVCIYLTLNYNWVPMILIEDPSKPVIEACKESKTMMTGYRRSFIANFFSFIGWYMIGIFTLGIAYLWVYPYRICTFSHFYLKRKDAMNQL